MAEDNARARPPQHQDIVKIVCAELEKHNSAGIELNEGTDITAELAIDSVAVMDMVFELEERFDIAVPLNQLGQVHTIGQLADLVRSLAETGGQENV